MAKMGHSDARQQVHVPSRKARKLCRRGDSFLPGERGQGRLGAGGVRGLGWGGRAGLQPPTPSDEWVSAGKACTVPPRPSPASALPPCRGVWLWLWTWGGSVLSRIAMSCALCTVTRCSSLLPHTGRWHVGQHPPHAQRPSSPRDDSVTGGCYSPKSRVQCVPYADRDNGPGNSSEGRSSRSLQGLSPPREAASRWLGSSFVAAGTFLWIPSKSIFSLFKTLTGRTSCLPSRPDGKFVFPGHV